VALQRCRLESAIGRAFVPCRGTEPTTLLSKDWFLDRMALLHEARRITALEIKTRLEVT